MEEAGHWSRVLERGSPGYCRAEAVAWEQAGQVRGVGPTQRWQAGRSPGLVPPHLGVQSAPRVPARRVAGGLPIPVTARSAGEARRGRGGWGRPRSTPLPFPRRDPRCPGYRQVAVCPPQGRGRVPRPRQVRSPRGQECGVAGSSGRTPGSRGCFRPGLGGGRGEGGPAGAGGRSGAGPADAALSPLFPAVAAPRREGRAAGAVFRPSVSG